MGERIQVFGDSEQGIEGQGLRRQPERPARRPVCERVATREADLTGVGLDPPANDPNKCRLAGAVRTQESVDFAWRHLEANGLQDTTGAEAMADSIDLQD
jgi:hypothetical protein